MTSARLLLVLTVTLAASACSNDSATPVSPTLPTTSFTFNTSITAGGTATRTFQQFVDGGVAMTLTSVTPDVPLGIGIGIPTNAGGACSLTRALVTTAGSSPQITITAERGTWCVRVWETGAVDERVSFSLAVTHH